MEQNITVNEKGKSLHEGMAFKITERYKDVILKENNGYYDVYFFSHAAKKQIESLGAQNTNVIDIVFCYDGA